MGINFHTWVLLLALALVFVAYYGYRNTTPTISRRLRIVLVSLRVAAFLLVVFLLMDPRYVYQTAHTEPARVVALIDHSASMSLPLRGPDSALSRFEKARGVSEDLRRIIESGKGTYSEAFFSGDLRATAADTVRADGQGTDIGPSLARLYEKYEGENLSAVILLSDGVETSDPLVRHYVPPVPVFAVGLGDTNAPEDVLIKDVDYSALVRAPSRSTIKASLRYTGKSGKRFALRLREANRDIFSKDTLFAAGTGEIKLEIPVDFPKAGRRAFVLEAVVEGYDAEDENNRRDIVVEAEKAGMRILIVDLLPAWELHFLSDFLRQDETFDFDLVSTLGERARPQQAGLEPSTDFVSKLDDYDALVLVSVNDGFMNQEVSRAITKFVRSDGKGLLVLPGHSSLFEHAAAWGRISDLLPVRGTPPHRFNLQFTSVHPGAQAATNPITAQLVPLFSQTDWQQRSPLLGYYSRIVPKTGVEVLLETDQQRFPAFIYQSVGKGRVALLSAGPLWRWKFLSDGNTMYDEMISRLLDVLSRGEDTERFVLYSKKNVYDSGETPKITAEIFDDRMQPVTGAAVRMEITRLQADGGEVPLDI
ncbi:MAG: hypothetical protein OEN01_12315 [Candidatus Krumholzibacteria bacterium]|nr:hypothetical protein [Candidatus Krumholzibacteria bacterium]